MIAVFLAAYSIPVTFGSVVHVIGSSSAANVTSVTPGAVGVTQAANAAALRDYADGATATAYSLSQQLVTSATNVGYALVLVLLIFGWTGGKALVSTSYSGAKEKVHKPKTRRTRGNGRGRGCVMRHRSLKVGRVIVVWVINTAALMLLAWILQGFSIESWGSGLALAAVLGLLNALVWPLLIRVALPLTVITLGFGVLLLNGVFVWLASDILAGSVQISGLWTAVVVALGLTLINNTVTLFLGIDDDDLYYREVIKRHARKSKETAAPTNVPGVLFLEIDGLAHDVLVRAMRDGSAPTMAAWLRNGSHTMTEWECDWSSQTGSDAVGDLAGLELGHAGFPLVGEGQAGSVRLEQPQEREGDREAALERQGPPVRRRGQ